MNFLDQLKEELRPSSTDLNKTDEFIAKINNSLKKSSLEAKCVRGGSTAKGTFLKNDHDVDIFAIFGYKYKNKNISRLLYDAIKSLNPDIIHGSRDYYQIKKGKLTYEIVPVLEIKDLKDIENVTDMSPHHVAWVNSKLNDNLRDDIRLTKKFCKAAKCYGAESYISGFSGHVIDILIINYGGFINLLNAAKDWTPKVIIDVESKIKDPLQELDKSKTYGPLIVIDPVQFKRNAAAAISTEKFNIFIDAAKKFLKHPSKEFFIETEFDTSAIKQKYKKNPTIILNIKTLDQKTDIAGAKLVKAYEFIKKQLELHDFTIIDSGWKWDKKEIAQIYIVIKEELLPDTFIRMGPPITEKYACKAFKEKNKIIFEKDKRLYANVHRTYRKPIDLIKHLIKDEYILKKVKEIKIC